MGVMLLDIGMGKNLGGKTPKIKIDLQDYLKLKQNCTAKEIKALRDT